MIASMKILLTLKPDHTYISSQSGGPGGAKSDTGKWSISGSDLVLTGNKTKSKGQHFLVSKDGHSMKMDSSKLPSFLSVTFTR